jgi:hypothetical protein
VAASKTWRPLYEHLPGQGLSSTAALVILARRIARTAWSIYTHKTDFDPSRLTSPCTSLAEKSALRKSYGISARRIGSRQ